MAIELVAFDLGSTLFEYKNMPLSWADYYKTAFEYVNNALSLGVSDEKINHAEYVMKMFNPRINPREIDYPPEFIFASALDGWNVPDLNSAINLFFESFNLKTEIYPDSIPVLAALKQKGVTLAALTDVPSGMPDSLYKKGIECLLPCFDDYLSSCSLGVRKPNPHGLTLLMQKYKLLPNEVLFVGDEDKDFETAKNANCWFIRVDKNKKHEKSIQTVEKLLELF